MIDKPDMIDKTEGYTLEDRHNSRRLRLERWCGCAGLPSADRR